jgi:hypothetical protein
MYIAVLSIPLCSRITPKTSFLSFLT